MFVRKSRGTIYFKFGFVGMKMDKIKIGTACDILNGFAFKSENYTDAGLRVIRIANVQKGYIEDVTPAFYPCDSKGLDKYMLEEGDLLMSLTGNVGRVALLEKEMLPAALNQRVACLRLKSDQISKGYLFHILNSDFFEKQCIQSSKGVAQKNMSTEWLKEYEISLYSIEQQRNIENILDKVRTVIESRKKEIHQLDELIKARFVELFGDPKYNKSNLVKIGEIGTLTSGGTPSRAKPEYFEGDIRWYSAGELNSLYLPDSVEHISETALQQSSAKLFNKGTLMIGMYDTAAFKMGILTEDSSSNQACANLNPKQGYDIVWLYYLFDMMKPIFLQERQGVRQKNLSLSKIKEFEVPYAPFELQNQFAAFVEQTDKSKFINKIHNLITPLKYITTLNRRNARWQILNF